MTSANGLEQRPGRPVLRGPRQLPKVAQNPACGPPWQTRHPPRHLHTCGCRPPGGSARCAPSPRPAPWAAGRRSHGPGGRSRAGRSRARAIRPWPHTHAVAPSRAVDSSGSAPCSHHRDQAAWEAAPGLGIVPRVASRLPSRPQGSGRNTLGRVLPQEATFSYMHQSRPWRICRCWSSSGRSP